MKPLFFPLSLSLSLFLSFFLLHIFQGGLDGGLNIPHNEKRFPGFIDKKYDAEMHKGYIFGSHVAEYMGTMEEEEPEKYQSHFKNYIDGESNQLESI